MKCFTVKVGDSRFIANVSRVIKMGGYYYNRAKGIETVTNENDAKHYKTKGQANAWIKSNRKRYGGEDSAIEELKAKIKEHPNHLNVRYWQNRIDTMTDVLKSLEDARVVELDIELPNFYDKDAIKFDEYQSKYGGMDLRVDGTAKRVCKCCGVKMKNIPYFEFRNSNSFRVCVGCLHIRLDKIQSAWDGMPEDKREELSTELILKQL